eukprot:8462906-Karenia_brevis.AAC.1
MMPWTKQLLDDFDILKAWYGSKLEELPSPHERPQAWEALMRDFPQEWKFIVQGYVEYESPWTDGLRPACAGATCPFRCNISVPQPAFK